MSKVRVTLPPGEPVVTGKQVTFAAPCDCSSTECLQINGVDYLIVDSLGNNIAGQSHFWASGSLVAVVLDVESKKATMLSASSITGNAATATKLQTPRTVVTNLGSESSASFDGTKNIAPGVSGTLPVSHGGTGQTSLEAVCRDMFGIAKTSASDILYFPLIGPNWQENGFATLDTVKSALGAFFSYGTSAPSNTNLLWIDTNATTGGLKYYNGSTWVAVPVQYT